MTPRKDRIRLDVLIFERGLAGSREKAQAMILAGEVLVNGAAAAKAGQAVARDAVIEIHSRIQKYVSRGGFSWKERCRISPSIRLERFAWTLVRRMAGLRIACCSMVQAAFTQWTSMSISLIGSCCKTRE